MLACWVDPRNPVDSDNRSVVDDGAGDTLACSTCACTALHDGYQKQKATADDVAEFLAPYVDAGCAEFNLIPQSPDDDQAVAGVAASCRRFGASSRSRRS
jgi:hypothetical protein